MRRSSPFGGLPVRGQDPNVAAALLRYADLLRAAEEWRLASEARAQDDGGSRVPAASHPSRLARLMRAFATLRPFAMGRTVRGASCHSLRPNVPESVPEREPE